VKELTLGANLLLSDLQRLTWKEQSNYIKDDSKLMLTLQNVHTTQLTFARSLVDNSQGYSNSLLLKSLQ